MPQKQMLALPYRTSDEEFVVSLWQACELTVQQFNSNCYGRL